MTVLGISQLWVGLGLYWGGGGVTIGMSACGTLCLGTQGLSVCVSPECGWVYLEAQGTDDHKHRGSSWP